MKELSLNITDIVQNSISANATLIEIEIIEDLNKDILKIHIKDNGKGMSDNMLQKVCDPFSTTRTTRKVGLGLPLFKMAAQRCNGNMEVHSKIGKGTVVKAEFVYSHIDRAPLGNMGETILTLVVCNPSIDFIYRHIVGENSFNFNTMEIKKIVGDANINEPEVVLWIKEYLNEKIANLYGGVSNEEFS